jgi:hypothetical protein
MKTHDLAKQLSTLSRVLRQLPNMQLEDLGYVSVPSRRSVDQSSIPVALSTLVALNDIDKRQWIAFIQENNFPIEIRARDASRDILGKLLKFLEQNPEARGRLTSAAQRERTSTAPEIRRALDVLLKS